MGNAIDTLEGVEQPQLAIATNFCESQLSVSIQDNGWGNVRSGAIANLQSLFYDQADWPRHRDGPSISYQIVTERHGGSLICESSAEKGTTFIIQIPNQPLA